ncbi:hypothetical protein EDC94DRAFT_643991 [Helicostylum pulchrum]|nr:hypothetical protein EDC94DRAFT_643991 [Helicostylum pulchrum]
MAAMPFWNWNFTAEQVFGASLLVSLVWGPLKYWPLMRGFEARPLENLSVIVNEMPYGTKSCNEILVTGRVYDEKHEKRNKDLFDPISLPGTTSVETLVNDFMRCRTRDVVSRNSSNPPPPGPGKGLEVFGLYHAPEYGILVLLGYYESISTCRWDKALAHSRSNYGGACTCTFIRLCLAVLKFGDSRFFAQGFLTQSSSLKFFGLNIWCKTLG